MMTSTEAGAHAPTITLWDEAPHATVAPVAGVASFRPGDHTGPRIMVADDDKGFREMLRDLLSEDGYEVVGEAANGAEAVALAPALSPDVVFMDLRMPQVDGIEATRLVKSALPMVQVIMLSAYDDPGLQRGAQEVGVYCYLIKGCPPQMIREMLKFAWGYKLGLQQTERSNGGVDRSSIARGAEIDPPGGLEPSPA